jgi:transcriptional regulator of arginine metabolism
MYIYALAARRQFPERPFALGIECGAMKLDRHNAIRQLVTTRVVTSQDELRRLLVKRGHEVTPEANHDEDLPEIADILRDFGLRVRQAMNQLVVVTTQGSAQPVAAGIDDEGWPEVVGTIAGDNTVLIICPDTKSATTLKARLEELIG